MAQTYAHRTIVAVDIADFGNPGRTNVHYVAMRNSLYEVLRTAFDEARVPWDQCDHEDRGDGALILVPPEFPTASVVDQVSNRLVTGLLRQNAVYAPEARIRLRIAVHSGEVDLGGGGIAGSSVDHAFRLLEAREAKSALREPDGVLALIVSDLIFQEKVAPDPGMAPASFRQIAVAVKDMTSVAWLRIFGATGSSSAVPALFPEDELYRLHDIFRDIAVVPGLGRLMAQVVGSAVPIRREGDLWEAVAYLVELKTPADDVPPLMAFVELLAGELSGRAGDTLRDWNNTQARRLGLQAALRVRREALEPPLAEAESHAEPIPTSPDGTVWAVAAIEVAGSTMIVEGRDSSIRLYPVGSREWSDAEVPGAVFSIAKIPGADAILSGGRDGIARIHSLPDLGLIGYMQGHSEQINSVATVDVNGRVMGCTASDDGSVRVWDLGSHGFVKAFELDALANAVTIATSAAGMPVVVAGSSEGAVVVWDLESGVEQLRADIDRPVHGLVVMTVDGRQKVVAVGTQITVVDLAGESAFRVSNPGSTQRSVATLAEQPAMIICGNGGAIVAHNLLDSSTVRVADTGMSEVWALATYRDNGRTQVVCGTDQGIQVWPVPDSVLPDGGLPDGGLPRGAAARRHAGFSPDTAEGEDHLGITAEVNTLCDVIMAKEISPPLSVGLFGDWGTGKSFFMGQMRDRIDLLARESQQAQLEGAETALCASVCQVEFNAWHYVDADLWASLAATIFDRLAAADQVTVSEDVLRDLPSVRALRDDLKHRRTQTRHLLAEATEQLGKEEPVRLQDVVSVNQLGSVVAKEALNKVDDALIAAGVPKDKAKELDLRTVAETTGGIGRNLWFVLRRSNWVARLVVFVAVLLVIAGPPLATVLLRDQLNWLTTAISSCVVVAFLAAKPFINRAAKALKAAEELVKNVDERRNAPVQARQELLRKRMMHIEEQILAIDGQIQLLANADSISAFALQRHEDDHYRSHEGLVATLRRDLEELSRRLTTRDGRTPDLERIVLYVDDLDRCPPDRVVEVLQAIHLLLAFPLFVVVVGVDSRWLLRSLDGFLQPGNDPADRHWASTPQNYLEKIFQVSFCLRPMSAEGYAHLVTANVGGLDTVDDRVEVAVQQQTVEEPTVRPVAIPEVTADVPAVITAPVPAPLPGREVRRYQDSGPVLHVSFMKTRPMLVSADASGSVTCRDLRVPDPVRHTRTAVKATPSAVHLTGDDRLLFVGPFGKKLGVVTTLTGDLVREITGIDTDNVSAACSPDSDDIVFSWRTADGKELSVRGHVDTAELDQADATPETVLAASRSWRVVRTGDETRLMNAEHSVAIGACETAVIGPLGNQVATIGPDRSVCVWSLNGEPWDLAPIKADTIALSGTLLAAADDLKVSIWDTAARVQRSAVTTSSPVTALAFAPDGRRLAAGMQDGGIQVWAIKDREPGVDLTAGVLRLTTEEHAMIVGVRPLIGTPRSTKRLINTYRLLRAGLGEADIARLRSGECRVVILLLALLIGEPVQANDLLVELSDGTALPSTFSALIRRQNPQKPEAHTARRQVAGKRAAQSESALEATVNQIIESTGTADDIALYSRWAATVARFSFRFVPA